jgi:tRNA pseudouridine38-40 synthase
MVYTKIGKTFVKRTLEPGFTRYILGIQYNGSNYSGYAKNNNQIKKSIEDCIENAIKNFVGNGNFLNFKGSSRTDTGVHAIRNVSQVDLIRRIPSKNKNNSKSFHIHGDGNNFLGSSEDVNILKSGINYYLKQDIGIFITDVTMADGDFDVRGSSTSRTYMYRIITPSINSLNNTIIDQSKYYSRSPQTLFQNNIAWNLNQVLDVDAMMKASLLFLGEQDFSSLRNSGCQSSSPFRNIHALEIHEFNSNNVDSNNGNNVSVFDGLLMKDSTLITINITANAFLMKMCRNIVGILVQVGLKKLSIQDVKQIINIKNRSLVRVQPAPPHGLYLFNVYYDINR